MSKDRRKLIHYFGSATRIVIPKSVEFLGNRCFYECKSLKEVIFEDGCNLKRIDECAFKRSGLKSIRIPKSVEFLGKECFSECQSLSEVIFEDGCTLKRIDEGAFSFSGLKSIRIPKSVEFLGKECFSECKSLTEVIFEDECNLKRIDASAFKFSGLKSIRIPKSVEFLGKCCFLCCLSLNEVIFTGEVEIGSEAFALSSVKNVKVPVGVKLNCSFNEDCRIEFVASAAEHPRRVKITFGKVIALQRWTPISVRYGDGTQRHSKQ
jgi:hypothetical protein